MCWKEAETRMWVARAVSVDVMFKLQLEGSVEIN